MPNFANLDTKWSLFMPRISLHLEVAPKDGIALEDESVLVVQHLFRAGLLQKRGCKYQKDSPDLF
jgi:hypothetical protein